MATQTKKFRDKISLRIQAGRGGRGVVRFDAMRRPVGGDGGRGASIFLRGNEHRYDLGHLEQEFLYEAPNGTDGGENNLTGAGAQPMFLDVPLLTKVYSAMGEVLGEVTEHGQEFLVAQGGNGGWGNFHFRRGGKSTLYKTTPARLGDGRNLKLELELQSDVIFIGLPNAGKSSLLNALTAAQAKVANYPFTTLQPQLGIAPGHLRLLDLPGLIEQTHAGKGLGTEFERHTRSARLVAHFVALDDPEATAENYRVIRKELSEISADLGAKPEVLIFSKSDIFEGDQAQFLKDFAAKTGVKTLKIGKNCQFVSISDKDALQSILGLFRSALID